MTVLNLTAGDGDDRAIALLKRAVKAGKDPDVTPRGRGRYRTGTRLVVKDVEAEFGKVTVNTEILFVLPGDPARSDRDHTALEWPTLDGRPATRLNTRYEEYDGTGEYLRSSIGNEYDYETDRRYYYTIVIHDVGVSPRRHEVAVMARDALADIAVREMRDVNALLDVLAQSPLRGGPRAAERFRELLPTDLSKLDIEDVGAVLDRLNGGIQRDVEAAVIDHAFAVAERLSTQLGVDPAVDRRAQAMGYRIESGPIPYVTRDGRPRQRQTFAVVRRNVPISWYPEQLEDGSTVDPDFPRVGVDLARKIITEGREILGGRDTKPPRRGLAE